MASAPPTDLQTPASEIGVRPERAGAGVSTSSPDGIDLSYWRESSMPDASPAVPSQTPVLWLIIAAVIITTALLIGGGIGSPGFSLGLAIGVGVAGFPCVLMFAADYASLRSADRRQNPHRKPNEEDWQRFWAPRGASRGPEGSTGWTYGSGESESSEAGPRVADPLARVQWAYELFGLPTGAPPAAVRTSYHRLAHQFHPDLVRGQPEQLRRDAEQRMKELNAAYELLRGR